MIEQARVRSKSLEIVSDKVFPVASLAKPVTLHEPPASFERQAALCQTMARAEFPSRGWLKGFFLQRIRGILLSAFAYASVGFVGQLEIDAIRLMTNAP